MECLKMLLFLVPSLLPLAYGEENNLKADGCGNKAEMIFLVCPAIGLNVTTIRVASMLKSYKNDCPSSSSIQDCTHAVTPDDAFYQKILTACENEVQCVVQAQYISMPLCDTNKVWANFIEVTYSCIENGYTVPATKSTIPLPTTKPATLSWWTTVTRQSGNLDIVHNGNGNDDSNSKTIIIGVILSLLFLILILAVVLSLLYRMKKLPRKVHKPMKSAIGKVKRSAAYTGILELIEKMRNKSKKKHPVSMNPRRESTTPRRESTTPRRESTTPEPYYIDEDETYCSIDELDRNKQTPHEYLKCHQSEIGGRVEISAPTPVIEQNYVKPATRLPIYSSNKYTTTNTSPGRNLPKVLVLPSTSTTSNLTECKRDCVVDEDIYNDPGFSDTEFDTDSESGEDNHQHDDHTLGDNSLNTTRGDSRRYSDETRQPEMKPNEIYDCPPSPAVYSVPIAYDSFSKL